MLQKNDKGKIIFFTESAFKVVEQIFNYPNKVFHIRMLARKTGLSTTAVMKAIEKLKHFKIVKIEKTDITTNIRADIEAQEYRFYKQVFNLYRINRYSFVNNLITSFNNPEAIILFGSFARGEDIEESDIDIAVISPVKVPQDLKIILNEFEKEMNREINLHVLPSLEKSESEFKNALANGIVLHGYLKVI